MPVLGENQEVILSCRIAPLPWVLDSIRVELSEKLKRPVTLIVRPASYVISLNEIASGALLLTERVQLPEKLECVGVGIGLVWCLGVRVSELEKVASGCPQTFSELLKYSELIRKSNNDGYPWFESLYGSHTLLRLENALGAPEKSGSDDVVGSNSSSLISLLHDALDRKLINPLSLEADETMAFDVLEAGDCVFASLWIPERLFLHPKKDSRKFKELRFVSFPGRNGPISPPRITFHLFSLKKGDSHSRFLKPKSKDPESCDFPHETGVLRKFSDCDFHAEKKWIQEVYPILYNSLINRKP